MNWPLFSSFYHCINCRHRRTYGYRLGNRANEIAHIRIVIAVGFILCLPIIGISAKIQCITGDEEGYGTYYC